MTGKRIAIWQSLHVNFIYFFFYSTWIVVANIAGFLARPSFPTGYGQAPRELYTKSPSLYYAEVKRLSKIKT